MAAQYSSGSMIVLAYRSPTSLTASVMTHNRSPLRVVYADRRRLPSMSASSFA